MPPPLAPTEFDQLFFGSLLGLGGAIVLALGLWSRRLVWQEARAGGSLRTSAGETPLRHRRYAKMARSEDQPEVDRKRADEADDKHKVEDESESDSLSHEEEQDYVEEAQIPAGVRLQANARPVV